MGWDAGGVNAVSCYLYGVAALLSLWHVFERSRLEHDLNARLRPLEASGQHARVRRRMRLFSLFLFCGLVTRCAWFALRESGFGGDECKKILVCPDWLLLVLDRFSTLAFFVAYTLLGASALREAASRRVQWFEHTCRLGAPKKWGLCAKGRLRVRCQRACSVFCFAHCAALGTMAVRSSHLAQMALAHEHTRVSPPPSRQQSCTGRSGRRSASSQKKRK